MNISWRNIVDDVQGYISQRITPLPFVYIRFLKMLMEMEQARTLCLLPYTRFEIFHAILECRVRTRLKLQEQRKSA